MMGKNKKDYQKEYCKKNKDRLLAYQKEWRKNNPDKVKISWDRYYQSRGRYWKRYKITKQQYEAKAKQQNGVCAICGCPQPETNKKTNKLTVDHNHKTGKVRGLLCTKCNLKLGCIEDAEFVKRAKIYLKCWQD